MRIKGESHGGGKAMGDGYEDRSEAEINVMGMHFRKEMPKEQGMHPISVGRKVINPRTPDNHRPVAASSKADLDTPKDVHSFAKYIYSLFHSKGTDNEEWRLLVNTHGTEELRARYKLGRSLLKAHKRPSHAFESISSPSVSAGAENAMAGLIGPNPPAPTDLEIPPERQETDVPYLEEW